MGTNKLDNAAFLYLDSLFSRLEIREGTVLDHIFTYPDEYYGLVGINKRGDLFVYYSLIVKILRIFPIDETDSLYTIGRYIEDRYKYKVKHLECSSTLYEFRVDIN